MQLATEYFPLADWSTRGREKDENGYIVVQVPEHPKSFRGGKYYEHRLVMERQYGRILERWETVHHINDIKTMNDECNLVVCTEEEHRRINVR